MDSKFFTKQEAAKYLKVSVRTIDNYIASGAIQAYASPTNTDRSHVRLLVSDVENFFVKKNQS